MASKLVHPGSFRDPDGFVFSTDGAIYRQINRSYSAPYDQLMQSGLYDSLVRDGMLIPHVEVDLTHALSAEAHKVIRPDHIAFVSYPYEWCFSQLKHAALLTLQVQKRALEHGMSLKDASAYNVQFEDGKPIFIDTASFELYREGRPWVAYGQFCQHFLAPLALMSRADVRMQRLSRVWIDGVPLDLASSLLPIRTWIDPGLLSHIHLHASARKHITTRSMQSRRVSFGRTSFLGLIDNLQSSITALRWRPRGTEWEDYASLSRYSPAAAADKGSVVGRMLDQITPAAKQVWDIGANIGTFSRLASARGIPTISFDADEAAVEKNYLQTTVEKETNLLPLVMDLTNPSPSLGWASQERMSLLERGPADLVLALALVHHLAISNNVPFSILAEFLSKIGRALVIEFVPRSDPQVQKLLAGREDIFTGYGQDEFEHAFGKCFQIQARCEIKDTERTVYLMMRSDA